MFYKGKRRYGPTCSHSDGLTNNPQLEWRWDTDKSNASYGFNQRQVMEIVKCILP